jgi:hypothetical protein
MTNDLVKAAVLNAVKLSGIAANVTASKEMSRKYPNQNKIDNLLMRSIESVQQMSSIMEGADNAGNNPLTTLINALSAQGQQPQAQQPVDETPAWAKELIKKTDQNHRSLTKLHHRVDAVENAQPST